ncbi:MAG: hypothetical protein LBD46_01600 [Endomicrobium sp.]|nr:hypothetical protein [Endomicrobium sp.]
MFSAYRDAAVIQYNPALMAFLHENVVNFTRFNLYEGSGYNSGSIILNYFKYFQAGLSVSNLSSGKAEKRESIYVPGVEISANSWDYVLSGAGIIKPIGLAFGMNIKYIYYDLYEKSGGTFAIDFGLAKIFNGPKLFGSISEIKFGLSAQNIVAGNLKLDSENDDIPSIYRLSSAFIIPVYYRFQNYDTVSIYTDLKYEDDFLDFYGGLAYMLANKYFVRAGYYPQHFTFGFGIDFYSFTVDYAADFGELDMINRLGLSYRWGASDKNRQPGGEELDKEAKEALNKEKLTLKEAEKKFNAAKKLYNNGEYLRATDMLSEIVISYPNFQSPLHFYTKMRDDMNRTAESDEDELNFSKRTYAKGYYAYYVAKYNEALTEWNKYVHFTGGSGEIFEYMDKINSVIKQHELMKREAELDAKANKMLADGIVKYKASKWILCIKDMEALQKFVTNNKFSKTVEYYNKAKEYIEKSVSELAKSIKTENKHIDKPKESEDTTKEKQEIDEASADKKYNEGLVLYAQGKYLEAERTWELTLRLNPNHRKAKIALSKLRSSGYEY